MRNLLLFQVMFKGIKPTSPEAPVRSKPGVDLDKRFGAESVPVSLPFLTNLDQAGIAQYPKVLGDAGLTQSDVLDQFSNRALTNG
jgi:hypothetical protein